MRILVVEDEEGIAKFLKAGLESEYFAVDIAEDGEKGSYFARTNDYDVIVLDNMLPKKMELRCAMRYGQLAKLRPSSCFRPAEKWVSKLSY